MNNVMRAVIEENERRNIILQKIIKGKNFNEKQIHEIDKGLWRGVDPTIYAKECFSWEQMRQIY